jgi:hypothetical protein
MYAVACRGTFPKRKLNGGLYTGEPFRGDWGNRPFFPDQGYIVNERMFLGSHQTPDGTRPYNTTMRIVDRVVVPELSTSFPMSSQNHHPDYI